MKATGEKVTCGRSPVRAGSPGGGRSGAKAARDKKRAGRQGAGCSYSPTAMSSGAVQA